MTILDHTDQTRFDSIHGHGGDARDNHLTDKINPSIDDPTMPKHNDYHTFGQIRTPINSDIGDPVNWNSNTLDLTYEGYVSFEKNMKKGWCYLHDIRLPDFLKHDVKNVSLEDIRRFSPHEHALSGVWAKQMPFYYSSNNYIYVHNYRERFSKNAMSKMEEGAFILPDMPLNRNIYGVKKSKFGIPQNDRAVRRTPGIVSPLLDHQYLYSYLDDNDPYFIGEQGGKGVIFKPNYRNQEVEYRFFNTVFPAAASQHRKQQIKDRAERKLERGESYYLSLSPLDEDFRPCDGTVWYNTSSIGVSIMTRDGFSRVVLPNIDEGVTETLLDIDFMAGKSIPHSNVVGKKKGLWCLRTIQGGLDSLYENLKMLGILEKIEQSIEDKENNAGYVDGLRVTLNDIEGSFGDKEELLKALTEMGIPISVINDEMVSSIQRDKTPLITKEFETYVRPYSNAVVYGLTVAYFISEEELRNTRKANKALYDTELDVLINTLYKGEDKLTNNRRYATPVPILHPHVYDNLVRVAVIQQHGTNDVNNLNISNLARDWHMPSLYRVGAGVLVSRNKDIQTLYRRMVVGNEASVVEIKALVGEGVQDLQEGVYILQDSDDLGGLIQIRLDLHDYEKLEKYGFYRSKADAEAYVVIKETEAMKSRLKEMEVELARAKLEHGSEELVSGGRVRESKEKEAKQKEKEAKLKAKIAEMEHERKVHDAEIKASTEKLSTISNMLIGTGTILTAVAGLGTLVMKFMSAKATTATAAKAALSAAGSGTISTGVGTALGVVAKVGAAVGTGIAAASSTPLILVGLGLAAVGGLCAWAAGWFD